MTSRERAHTALMDAITRAPAPVPCVTHPTPAWVSDDMNEQRQVAHLCRACPILDRCRDYLHTYGERAGVWAGTTLSQRWADTGKPKEQP